MPYGGGHKGADPYRVVEKRPEIAHCTQLQRKAVASQLGIGEATVYRILAAKRTVNPKK
jgi:hypothetical protein